MCVFCFIREITRCFTLLELRDQKSLICTYNVPVNISLICDALVNLSFDELNVNLSEKCALSAIIALLMLHIFRAQFIYSLILAMLCREFIIESNLTYFAYFLLHIFCAAAVQLRHMCDNSSPAHRSKARFMRKKRSKKELWELHSF